MSRIYDALQRADIERKTAEESEVTEILEPVFTPAGEKVTQVNAEVILENIALHSWNPSLASLPTLRDSGESIEQFRGLRTQIYQYHDQAPLRTILISSGMPGEGKTFVAANLALSLARNHDNSVLLIDADLRKPMLHNILGAPNVSGLTEYLAETAEASEIMQRNQALRIVEGDLAHDIPNLIFIPAGAGGNNSSELLANHRIEELLATLSPYFDWIVIDSPPVLAFSDAIDLARAADAVLLVARGATTPYDVAQRAQAAFINFRILGFVLNAVKDAPRNGSYYYYQNQEDGGGPHGRKGQGRKG
jgi:capsular exopolysaccharide synthesis family protein